jgi:uncharacterized membrane protein (UPF0127 family)
MQERKYKMTLASIGLVVIISLAGFCLSCRPGSRRETGRPARRVEPAFKKEGTLAFIKDKTSDTLVLIAIEVASDEVEITQGLMWRHSMSERNGMLFVFEQETPLSFWMKNTYIPLDIIFVNRTGAIVAIDHDAVPLSEMLIPSGKPARYAVEVNAGFCVRYGISTGDRIAFRTSD